MSGITLDILHNLCKDETILMTQHAYNRCRERGIHYEDIKNVILNGEIIEQYADDFPYPSCLTLGASLKGLLIHVICGVGEGKLWIISAYYPNPEKWEPDFKTRKGNI
jgi:uncharacterized DUF497 family protein